MKITRFSLFRDYEIKCKLFEPCGEIKSIIVGVHGDCDDIVPPSVIREFVSKNESAVLKMIEGADHRFKNRGEIDLIIRNTLEYLGI